MAAAAATAVPVAPSPTQSVGAGAGLEVGGGDGAGENEIRRGAGEDAEGAGNDNPAWAALGAGNNPAWQPAAARSPRFALMSRLFSAPRCLSSPFSLFLSLPLPLSGARLHKAAQKLREAGLIVGLKCYIMLPYSTEVGARRDYVGRIC